MPDLKSPLISEQGSFCYCFDRADIAPDAVIFDAQFVFHEREARDDFLSFRITRRLEQNRPELLFDNGELRVALRVGRLIHVA